MERRRKRYLMIPMDYFTQWPVAYVFPNQETSPVAEELVTNWVCRFGVPWELHSDHGCNLKSHLLKEVLQCLGKS
jgi:hypothetical protein